LGRNRAAVGELLDAERDALLVDVDVENLRVDPVALLVFLDDLLTRPFPVEIRQVHHAVDVAVEPEEQAEFGLVLDLAFDLRAGRILLEEDLPRIAHGLLQPERDAALDRIDFEHLHLDLLRRRDDLAGMHVLLGPRHFGDVDQAFDARLELDEGAVIGDVGDAALEAGGDRILGLDALPRIVEQLLHAERDAVGLVVDLDDLDLDLLADVEHLGRMIDAPPCDVGDMQQAVDAAEVDERTVIGDVLHHAVDDLALFEVQHELLTLLGAGLFEDRAARHDDVAATAIHLEDLERLRVVHQRGNVADRTNVDLAARQERHGAVEIDREAALDLVEDDALDLLVALERLLELAPALLATRLVARQHRFAERVLDPLEIHLDGVADFEVALPARAGELADRNATLGLEADVDDGHVLLDGDDGALDHGPFVHVAVVEGLLEHRGKILTRRLSSGNSHELSCGGAPAVDNEWHSERTGPEVPLTSDNCQTRWQAGTMARRTERLFDLRRPRILCTSNDAPKAGPSGLILHDEGAVIRAFGPPGRPRQGRRRPGTVGLIRR